MEGNFRKCYPNDMMNILKMKKPNNTNKTKKEGQKTQTGISPKMEHIAL